MAIVQLVDKSKRGFRLSFGGNIGAGKSDHVKYLTEGPGKLMLENRFQRPVKAYYELPYIEGILPPFYAVLAKKDRGELLQKEDKDLVYHSELMFLNARKKMARDIERFVELGGIAIDDRSLPEDREIFIRSLKAQGILIGSQLLDYLHKYGMAMHTILPPDLFICLECDDPRVLYDRIHNVRKREVEEGIKLKYLSQLNRLYRCFILTYPHPILVLNAAEDCPQLRNGHQLTGSRYLEYNTDIIIRELRRQNLLKRLSNSNSSH